MPGPAAFWQADTRSQALEAIRADDRSGVFALVATDAVLAAQAFEEKSAGGIGAGVNASDFIARTLQQSTVLAQARVERGLTFLASVGSTAPFVGLFGTVWGIYHALVSLAGTTHVVLDKVAGPVGEALIMTGLGLAVAIPAVVGYNWLTRANRVLRAHGYPTGHRAAQVCDEHLAADLEHVADVPDALHDVDLLPEALRILEEDDGVDADHRIVLGNDLLARNVQNLLHHVHLATDAVDERKDEVETRHRCMREATEALDRVDKALSNDRDPHDEKDHRKYD